MIIPSLSKFRLSKVATMGAAYLSMTRVNPAQSFRPLVASTNPVAMQNSQQLRMISVPSDGPTPASSFSPSTAASMEDSLSSATTADRIKSILSRSQGEVEWKVDAFIDSFSNVASKAFAGSPTTVPEPVIEFGMRGIVPNEFNDDRYSLYKFVMGLMAEDVKDKDAFFFGHPSTGEHTTPIVSDLDKDSMASGVLLVDFDPAEEFRQKGIVQEARATIRSVIPLVKAAASGSLPVPLKDTKNFVTFLGRMFTMQEEAKQNHKALGPKSRHLYVNCVAMDPEYQGRGFGKQLMNQVSEIADELGLPAYLECAGERNPIFYQKFGYEVVGSFHLKAEEDGSSSDTLEVFAMVRQPNTAS